MNFQKNVIYADESIFNSFGSDGKTKVWFKPNEELNSRNILTSVKHVVETQWCGDMAYGLYRHR